MRSKSAKAVGATTGNYTTLWLYSRRCVKRVRCPSAKAPVGLRSLRAAKLEKTRVGTGDAARTSAGSSALRIPARVQAASAHTIVLVAFSDTRRVRLTLALLHTR